MISYDLVDIPTGSAAIIKVAGWRPVPMTNNW